MAKYFLTYNLLLLIPFLFAEISYSAPLDESGEHPLRLAIVGLVHGHVSGFLREAVERDDIDLVAVVEPQKDLLETYAQCYDLQEDILFTDIKKMLVEKKPEAVATFTSTFDHMSVVEACAPQGVHVMMEKPLAVGMQHAEAIKQAAEQHNIHVLVNYETTWYPSNHKAYHLVQNDEIGTIRKIVVRDGHPGPKEIGCSDEFLAWLTDPELNGAGALFDFGCYEANLMTWLMKEQHPTSVTAITQSFKPKIYPKVDDEATIIVTYPNVVGIIEASWNWTYNRKDMDIYGTEGALLADNSSTLRMKSTRGEEEQVELEPLHAPQNNPLSYLKAVVRGEIEPEGLSSLNNNMIVTSILSAARESAASGKTIYFRD